MKPDTFTHVLIIRLKQRTVAEWLFNSTIIIFLSINLLAGVLERAHALPPSSRVALEAELKAGHTPNAISLDASEKVRLLELRCTLILLSAHTKSERVC